MSTDDRASKDGVISPLSGEEASAPPVEEAVGYGRPPKATRFRKGQTGNPRGRKPQDSISSVIDVLNARLDRTIAVRANGKVKQATMLQVALLQLMLKAAKGDLGAFRLLLSWLKRLGLMTQSSKQPSGGIRLLPKPIFTLMEFEAWFELTPDGKHWRQRTERDARLYLHQKDLEARERAVGGGDQGYPSPLPKKPGGLQ